jgi:hypothetical protein
MGWNHYQCIFNLVKANVIPYEMIIQLKSLKVFVYSKGKRHLWHHFIVSVTESSIKQLFLVLNLGSPSVQHHFDQNL